MKLTMYYKDSVRKLKKSIFRYISIVIIIMLGVGFFVGMNSVAPDMEKTTEEYLKRTNIFDIQLISNLGYKDEDIEKIKDIENIKNVEGMYSYDVLTKAPKKNIAIRVMSSNKNSKINQNDLIEGKEIQKEGQCIIDTRLKDMYGYKIGEKIKIFKDNEDISKKITQTELEIVGVSRSPIFLSGFYGSTELANGELEGFMFVSKDIMKFDEYTTVYLKTNIDNNLEKTSDEYKKQLDKIAKKVEEVNEEIVNSKYDDAITENTEKISNNEEKINSVKSIVKNAKEELISSQIKINNSIIQIASNLNNNLVNQNNKLEKMYSTIKQLNVEKEEIESRYEEIKEEIEPKKQELFNMNNLINNKIYESRLLKNENSKYMSLIRDSNKLDYEYNLKKKEFDEKNKEYEKVSKELKDKKLELKEIQEEAKKEQEKFYNEFLKIADDLSNTPLKAYVDEIKTNQEELTASRTQLESTEIEENIEKAKNKIVDAKNDLSTFEPIAQTIKLYESSAFKSLDNDLEKMGIMGKVFPIMFFVVATLVTITTVTRMVEEDRMNVGTLKSLGYKKITIISRYVIYALSATVIGVALGTAIGSTTIAQILFDAYSSLYILPPLMIEINPLYTSLASTISIVATVGSTLIIALKELNEKTAMLLRPKQVKEGKSILLEKIPFIWKKMSFLLKICFRNIFRYKRRLFMTLIGISGCTMLIYTGISLKGTIDNITIRQFSEIRTYNMEVNLAVGANTESAEQLKKEIENNEKVREATPARQQMTNVEANDVNKDIFYTVIDKDEVDKYIKFKERETKNKIDLTDDGVILTEKLAKELKVKNGDTIKVIENDKEKTIQVIGVTENYLYNYMYLTPNLYMQIFEKDIRYNLLIANLNEVNEEQEVELSNQLKENEKIGGTVFIRNLNDDYKNSLTGLSSIVILFIGSASLLSFIVLINLNNINIEERRRELATFKLLGFRKNELEHYVFRENIILTILGAGIGIVLGIFVLGLIIQSAEVETIMIPVELNMMDTIISLAITIGFTIITNFVMKKKIKKIDMIESLKSVE